MDLRQGPERTMIKSLNSGMQAPEQPESKQGIGIPLNGR
jgi:hypothetical protein